MRGILVTGGSGGIGSAFLNRTEILSSFKIWNLDLQSSSSFHPNVKDLIWDLSEPPEATENFLQNSMELNDIDMIVHMADNIASKVHYIVDGKNIVQERWKF